MVLRGIGIFDGFVELLESKSDPRTSGWLFAGSPVSLMTLLAIYLYFANVGGPRFMKNRKPYDLKYVLLVYNALQVGFSIWLVWEGLQAGWLYHYSYKCQPVDYSNNPLALRMARAVWCYYMCKLVELLDTVFFVLRKKNNQVTYLHLWHHTLMPITSWIGVTFLAGGHSTLLGLINSFIHVIMYSYYLLAAMGPQVQKYLWWKKYLTVLQLIQFTIIFHHHLQPLMMECNYPKTINFLICINQLYFLYLFGRFYVKTYLKRSKTE